MENKNLEFFLLVGAWVVVLGMTWSSSFICSVIDSRVFLESNFKVSSLHGRVRSYFTRASIYVYKLCIYARNHLFSKNIAILSHEQKHLRETHFPIFLKIKISSNRYYITVSFTSRDTTLQHFFFKIQTWDDQHLENLLQPKKKKKKNWTCPSICNDVAEGVKLEARTVTKTGSPFHRYHPSASLKTPFSVLSKQKLT